MIRVGITGQTGFVGSHLYNRLSLLKEHFELVPFENHFFQDVDTLAPWVKKCDAIVHLAAINRHPDQQTIHDTNVLLVKQLLEAAQKAGNRPHVLFSSSSQEERDNLYGKSKKTGRLLLQQWAEENNAVVTGMIVPNVFGPFGKPFYNSVVATFCHQLCNGDIPRIDVDGQLKLIFVDELVTEIIEAIRSNRNEPEKYIAHTAEYKVSEILKKLEIYKEKYFDKGVFPELEDKFSLNLFNTFRSYINHIDHFPVSVKHYADERGVFVEMIRLEQGGQVSYSTTRPGITRGNHFHTRKIERFIVIKGKAKISLRKYNTEEVIDFYIDDSSTSYVDMPIWYTHNITNVGEGELYTIFWINEFFNPEDPDTFFEPV